MKKGDRFMFYIPARLGYGARGSGRAIPPNADLKFDVEMLDFEKAIPPPKPWSSEGIEKKTTASGLSWFDIKVGDGDIPQKGTRVTVHYTGYFVDKRIFDSSVMKNKPFTFVLGTGQVIKGWDEGVASMRVGGKRKLIVPSHLGYGSSGRGAIPPNSTLVFDVELLSVK
jgi:peptidylprolyl isomerase